MQKKILILILIILVICVFIFYKTHETSNKLTIWTIQLKPVATDFMQKNIEKFENEHDTKIVWVDIPIQEAKKRALASILSGNPPDLINLNPDFSMLLAKKDALYNFSEDEAKTFENSIMDILKYKGKIFALPFYATSSITICNKKCTKDKPKTFDDILHLENKCKNAFSINLTENDTYLKILNKYGINDENDKRISEVSNLFYKMYKNEIIPKDVTTKNHREVIEKYMANDTGCIVASANFVQMIKENAKDVYDNSYILPQLTGSTGLYDVSLMNFVIPKKAKNIELAREFLMQILDTKNEIEFAKLTNTLSVNKNALKDDFFTKNNDELTEKARIIGAKQLKKLNFYKFDEDRYYDVMQKLNLDIEKKLLK